MNIIPRKLYQQVISAVIVILVASNITYSYFVSKHHAEFALEEKKQNSMVIAENVAFLVANRLVVGDYAGLDYFLLQTAKLPDIQEIYVVEKTGDVVSRIIHNKGKDPQLVYERSHSAFNDIGNPELVIHDLNMTITYPVKASKHIANLEVVFSLEKIKKMRRIFWVDALYIGLFCLLVTILFLLLLLRYPIKSIVSLSGFARNLGDVRGKRISEKFLTEEIQGLADSINYATDRIETAEQDLGEERERLDATMQSINEGVIATDTELKIILFNKAAEKMTGWSAADAAGQNVSDVFVLEGTDGNPKELEFEFPLRPGQVVEHKEAMSLVAKTGEKCSIEFSVAPVMDRYGEIIGTVIVMRDITERLKALSERQNLEGQLRQAQKMEAIGTLAGGIAHDFNNVLTPILGYSEMIKLSHDPKDKVYGFAQEIVGASLRAKDLVGQILTFSRQSERELRPLPIDSIVKEAIKLLRSSIPTTIEIKNRINPDCGSIMGDPTKVHQIIMNLCTNAYHAMREEGGVLGLTLYPVEIGENDYPAELALQPGPYICLEVSDTGYGIPDEIKDKIFEPYFTTKNRKEGTGLGLSVVHGIMKSMNGHITVYSEMGIGTTFRLYFPKSHEQTVSEEGVVSKVLQKGKETIMLIDDDDQVLDLQKRILESLGYTVETCQSGIEGLEILKENPGKFDMVITDMTMPGMTGAVLAQKVIEVYPDMPVILCTGFSDIINEDKARSIGIRKYITKPIMVSEFTTAIREVFDG